MSSLKNDIRDKAMKIAKVYGEYKLHTTVEALNEAGDKIICKECGEVIAKKRYSSIAGLTIWDNVHRDDKGEIIKQGCSCYDRNLKAKKELRHEYFKANGRDAEYAWYYLDRHMDTVPFPAAEITNRFYMQNYTDGVAVMRDYIYSWDREGMDDNYYFQGNQGSFKTSLMCCIQFCLIRRATPCLITNPIKMANEFKYQNHLGELFEVDVLIIDDVGLQRINDRLSKEIENLLRNRKANGGRTLIASRYNPDELSARGYSDSLIKTIKSITGSPITLSERISE